MHNNSINNVSPNKNTESSSPKKAKPSDAGKRRHATRASKLRSKDVDFKENFISSFNWDLGRASTTVESNCKLDTRLTAVSDDDICFEAFSASASVSPEPTTPLKEISGRNQFLSPEEVSDTLLDDLLEDLDDIEECQSPEFNKLVEAASYDWKL